jgi:alkaline phosphatase D
MRTRICFLALLALGCDANSEDKRADAQGQTPAADTTASPPDARADAAPPEPDALPFLDGGRVATVAACTWVDLPGSAGRAGPWTADGDVLPSLRVAEDGTVSVRAPAVLEAQTLTIRSDAGRAQFMVDVTPAATQDPAWPALGLVPDCGPFAQGVAAGDPTLDGVVLWTRWTPPAETPEATVTLTWEVSEREDFAQIATQGTVDARPAADHTVRVEVSGLASQTDYYYRFTDAAGETSRTGHFRTAPADGVERLRLALVSCSSLYSGFFTAYRRIAERRDLDFVLHVGDYIYDFVDEDEHIRLPEPFPEEPTTLETHRARHAFYLLDPDLRAARAAHAWVSLWDNHDLEAGAAPLYEGGAQAFREWVPMRVAHPEAPDRLWRSLRFGDLLDLNVVDVLLWRGTDTLPASDAADMLGSAQRAWLDERLSDSTARWRVVANQKLFAPFNVPIDIGDSTWNGYPEARARVLAKLAEPGVGDTLILSGDAHFTAVADLPPDPAVGYDPATGAGSVAVELLGGSVTRGNIDESVPGGPTVYARLDAAFRMLNPHFAHSNLTEHGWGLVELSRDRVVVQMRYTPILAPGEAERADLAFEALHGARHWQRAPVADFDGEP